ncbi:bidirectional sugar transporter SWEET9-like [Silene latifolia]|uniref:bidirectional sugar transporter SWEET9-like n=1 Tax=Silene latifolia TaxID=37657 RepID=UPI003D774B61
MALTHFNHHELMYIFGILGNIVSLGVFLAPLPTFWRVFKKKSTEGFQALPYSVALFSCMLLLYYAMLKTQNAMPIITINSVGFIIEAFYLIVFLIYAPTKARVYTIKLLGLFNVTFLGLIIVGTMVFARGADAHNFFSKGGVRETSVGWICAVFSVCVFAAPLSVMKMVIKTKSVEFMPFCLSFSLTLCAVMWFFYGFLIQDFYIAMPNVLGFLLGITQMLLYIIYKNSSPKNQQKNLMVNDNDMKQLEAELGIEIIKLNNNMDKINKDQEIITNNNNNPEVVEIIVHDIKGNDIMTVDGGNRTVDVLPRV